MSGGFYMQEKRWNDNWLFWEDKNAFALIWDIPEHARRLSLPHDAMIHAPARLDSPAGGDGGFRNGGSYVYVKELFALEEWREQTVALRFDGVQRSAMVYVNGQRAASVPSGYTTFCVPLNDFLRYGQENQVRVATRTGDMPNSRWYSGGGIYRDVTLLAGGLVHVPDSGIRVLTRELDGNMALLAVETEICNRGPVPRTVRVRTELLAPDGSPAGGEISELTVMGGGRETVRQSLAVEAPRPWSAEHPSLYTCKTTLLTDGDVEADTAKTSFGIRTVTVDARRGLRINGEHVKLRGACVHHDSGLLGAATFAEAEYRRIRLLKEAGFNAIRSAHQPLAPAALRACDALGMYVMDEAFDQWTRSKKDYDYSQFFDREWRDDAAAMVRKDFNHPSVILYSLGNEIPEIATPHGAALGRRMYGAVRALDPTRPVLACVNGIFAAGDRLGEIVADVQAEDREVENRSDLSNVNTFMAATASHSDEIVRHPAVSRVLELASAGMDLIGYNYMTGRYEQDGAACPNRVIVGSETYPPEIARNWGIISRSPHVIGDFTWTGWDYLGESGVGVCAYRPGEGGFGAQYPCQLAYCGDIDITGYRRPVSYYREIVFGLRRTPYITVQDPAHYGQPVRQTPWVLSDNLASWTWPGFEGKPVVVEVYSPGDEVELLLNGVSQGRCPAGAVAGFRALFQTAYTPGTLEAVAYEQGRELSRWTLASTGKPICLAGWVEPGEGLPERELIYVGLALKDETGCFTPARDADLTAQVEGDAELAGFGSGDPKPLTGYTDGISRTFQGRAQAILRTEAASGCVVLTVAAEGLEPLRMEICW